MSKPGETVAVVGLGGVGLSCLLGAIVAGAGRIIAVDVSDEKLALARQLGATETYNARDADCIERIIAATDGGVDTAFEMAGTIKAMELSYKITVRGGTDRLGGAVAGGGAALDQPLPDGPGRPHGQGQLHGRLRDRARRAALHRALQGPQAARSTACAARCISLDDVNEGFDRLADAAVVRQMIMFD